jgi:UDP-sugar transporter A1/2/3
MHYSRIMPMTSANRYFASTAVFLNEVLKLFLCLAVAFRNRRGIDGPRSSFATTLKNLCSDIFRADNWKLAIPACLYTLQNRLQYVAVSNLDAATFQVTYQLKILTTALFSVTMLHRSLNLPKWISLVALTAGVGVIQLPSLSDTPTHQHHHRSATYEGIHDDRSDDIEPTMDRTVGLLAVIVACVLSGLAGVYFEKVLKGSSTSLWIRNVQLSFYSLFPALFVGVVFMDGKEIMDKGFFYGYNMVVWTAIVFQAFGGIVVALCVNYADNIAKNFATSVSILISCAASVYFFDFVITMNVSASPIYDLSQWNLTPLQFVIGACVVLFATWLYSKPDAPNPHNEEYTALEKTSIDRDRIRGDGSKHTQERTHGQ